MRCLGYYSGQKAQETAGNSQESSNYSDRNTNYLYYFYLGNGIGFINMSMLRQNVSLVFIAILLVVAGILFMQNRVLEDRIVKSNQQISNLQAEVQRQEDSIDVYCGEYRNLFASYKQLSNSTQQTVSYAIPGSAKGNVDECYMANGAQQFTAP
jgi:hypothetical protein